MLKHLRDFLTEEELQFLPGRLQSGTFILLKQQKTVKDDKGVTHFETPVQVFSATGTWIGQIAHPDYIPEGDK